jgi:glucokinase
LLLIIYLLLKTAFTIFHYKIFLGEVLAIIAIDLLSTAVTTAVISKTGKVMSKEHLPLNNLEGPQVSNLIQQQINKLLNKFANKAFQIRSVGISVPGIYFSKTGIVWAPNIPGWENYPLKHDMGIFLVQNIRVKIASKRTCDILGEKWQGAAKKSKNAIYLSIGKGIGAGVLIDGKILHGFNDGAGAVGWLAFDHLWKESYKERGCFEYYASSKGIINLVSENISGTKKYSGELNLKNLSIENIFQAYKMKDPIAVKVINKSIKYWGLAAANLVSLFNPEIIIFGGSVFGPGLIFLDLIKSESEKWAQPIFFKNVRFAGSQLGADAGLFGAGHLAIGKF